MIINPLNVVRLLLVSISSMYLTKIELKENIQKLLLDSIFYYNGLEVTEEIYLDFEESYKLHSFEIIEDEKAWNEDNLNSHSQCFNDDADFDNSYKRQAAEYWWNWDANKKDNNKKRNRSLQTVQHKFRNVSSERQLRRWEEQLQSGGSRTDKLSYISKFTYDKFIAAVELGFMVHDIKNGLTSSTRNKKFKSYI